MLLLIGHLLTLSFLLLFSGLMLRMLTSLVDIEHHVWPDHVIIAGTVLTIVFSFAYVFATIAQS